MHIIGCRQGTHSEIMSGIILHTYGLFPSYRFQGYNGEINDRGADIVLTYDLADKNLKETYFQQFQK